MGISTATLCIYFAIRLTMVEVNAQSLDRFADYSTRFPIKSENHTEQR